METGLPSGRKCSNSSSSPFLVESELSAVQLLPSQLQDEAPHRVRIAALRVNCPCWQFTPQAQCVQQGQACAREARREQAFRAPGNSEESVQFLDQQDPRFVCCLVFVGLRPCADVTCHSFFRERLWYSGSPIRHWRVVRRPTAHLRRPSRDSQAVLLVLPLNQGRYPGRGGDLVSAPQCYLSLITLVLIGLG